MTAGAAAVACPRWRATASAVSPASSASVACVRYGAMPVARYNGYLATDSTGAAVFMTTALDIVPSGEKPGGYAALVNPSCVGWSMHFRTSGMPRMKSSPVMRTS